MGNLHRIRRLSRVMQAACTFGMVAVPGAVALSWLLFDGWRFAAPALNVPVPDSLPLPVFSIGLVVALIPAMIAVVALSRLRRLFGLYSAGRIFDLAAVTCLRQFAWTVLLMAVIQPLVGALLSVIITLDNPPGQRALALSFGSAEVAAALLGGLMVVIAWVMREGCRLSEENEQIV